MRHRVRRERAPDLEDARIVAEAPHVVVDGRAQLVAGRSREMPDLTGQHLHDAAEIDRLEHHRELPGIDPREVEEIGGEPRETLNLPLHRFDEAAAGLLVDVLVREELQKASDRKQRRTQFMGGVRDELLARVVELRELNAHPVERASELADLVVAVIDDRRAEVAAGNPLRRGLESKQAMREHSRRGQAEDQGEHERKRRRQQEALANDLHGRERVRESGLEEHDGLGLTGTATSA